jgi:hypothetical protein
MKERDLVVDDDFTIFEGKIILSCRVGAKFHSFHIHALWRIPQSCSRVFQVELLTQKRFTKILNFKPYSTRVESDS